MEHSAALGFLGSMPRDDQIDHAMGYAYAVERILGRAPTSLIDLGTGGGVPGLVLADRWATTRVVLLDANERRTDFLREELTTWDVGGRVSVVRGRAEEIGRESAYREAFELVTARSFGPPAVTAECGAPLLAMGGWLVVSEPPGEYRDRWPSAGIAQVGLESGDRVQWHGTYGYQTLRKVRPVASRYPRRTGVPAKRPLYVS